MDTVLNWSRPTNIREIHSLLRLTGYYRRFIEGSSKIVGSLIQLTRKGASFDWIDKCEQRFEELKQKLVNAPILTIPEESEGFVIYSDASKKGLECFLMQHSKVVAYTSR